jgi:hypothetical protein
MVVIVIVIVIAIVIAELTLVVIVIVIAIVLLLEAIKTTVEGGLYSPLNYIKTRTLKKDLQ